MNSGLGLFGTSAILLLLNWGEAEGVRIDVDTSRAPDLADFGRQVKATLEDWYSRVVQLLNSPTFRPEDRIPLFFDPNYNGVAFARGSEIVGSVDYYRRNRQDVGSMVHEMAHVIQQYRKCDGWITEGIADWVRFFHYERPANRPGKPGRGSNFRRDTYRVAALNWIEGRYPRMIYHINKDCREGTYSESMFPRLVGKSVDQLWEEMMRG